MSENSPVVEELLGIIRYLNKPDIGDCDISTWERWAERVGLPAHVYPYGAYGYTYRHKSDDSAGSTERRLMIPDTDELLKLFRRRRLIIRAEYEYILVALTLELTSGE